MEYRLGAVTLDPSEDFLACASMSVASAGHALFGCDAIPSAVVKVSLGTGTNPPTRVGAARINSVRSSSDRT